MTEDFRTKALSFIREHPVVHLATVDKDRPRVRVMEVVQTDDDFTVWFACGKSSAKVKQIGRCPNVAVSAYADQQDLVVEGRAEVVADDAIRRQMWRDEWKRYFPGGPGDPEYCLIKVAAAAARYRDLKETGFEARDVL